MMIRSEKPEDVSAIGAVIMLAFTGHPHSDQNEHIIVERLRNAGALSVSLVAEDAGQIVGHISFSEILIDGAKSNWFCLAPLSVTPVFQQQGIGSLLVEAGLRVLNTIEAEGCVVAGDPNYYGRFGFQPIEGLVAEGIPREYFAATCLRGNAPSGIVTFHPSFDGDVEKT